MRCYFHSHQNLKDGVGMRNFKMYVILFDLETRRRKSLRYFLLTINFYLYNYYYYVFFTSW